MCCRWAARRNNKMNEIAILGHENSGLYQVEDVLSRCGMARPRPSKKDGLAPAEITQIICRAHGIVEDAAESPFAQLQVGPIWNGLALDLVLANIGQSVWGWADPNTVYLLDFWRELEPRMTFVLVYDSPGRLLSGCAGGSVRSADDAHERINSWLAYNNAIRRFYLTHPDRCLLVHSQQVPLALESYLEQLQARVGGQLLYKDNVAWPEALPLAQLSSSLPPDLLVALEAAKIEIPEISGKLGRADSYLAGQVIGARPECWKLYDQLQAIANLPLEAGQNTPAIQESALDAWVQMQGERRALELLITRLGAYSLEVNSRLKAQDDHIQAKEAEIQAQVLAIKQAQEEAQAKAEALDSTLLELQYSHEELVRTNQALHMRESALHAMQSDLEVSLQALQQSRDELHVKDEALRYVDQELRSKEEAFRQMAVTSESASRRADSYEAELALSRKLAEGYKGALAEAQRKMQLLETHSAQHAAGAVDELAEAKAQLLVNQIAQLQDELERRAQENIKTIRSVSQTAPLRRGAAERVKQDLPYRLGSLVVQHGATISLPWKVARETREFWRRQSIGEGLPPLNEFSDSHEAERVKQHLSYRLGLILVERGNRPLAWLGLPFALLKEAKKFKKDRKQKTV